MEYTRIDVDCHIQENLECWTSRMSTTKWGDRIPRVVFGEEKDEWYVDGKPTGFLTICPAVMPDRVTWPTYWSQIPTGVYDAKERTKYMDHDGIDLEVMYAHVTGVSGDRFLGMEPNFELECVAAYNDYQTEEWVQECPGRFMALCVPPHSSIDVTVAEVSRCAKMGHGGVNMYGTPHLRGLPNYSDQYWDPLWATCQDAGIAVHTHGSGSAPPSMRLEPLASWDHRRTAATGAAAGFSIQPQYFSNFLFAGVLERYPTLNFVSAESGIGWLPWLLEACDRAWHQGELWKYGLPLKPSDYFHRQCYVDFWYERSAIQEYRHVIGVDRIMWETDFPHPTSLWPNTKEFLARAMEGVPEDEQRMMLCENAKRVYHLTTRPDID